MINASQPVSRYVFGERNKEAAALPQCNPLSFAALAMRMGLCDFPWMFSPRGSTRGLEDENNIGAFTPGYVTMHTCKAIPVGLPTYSYMYVLSWFEFGNARATVNYSGRRLQLQYSSIEFT